MKGSGLGLLLLLGVLSVDATAGRVLFLSRPSAVVQTMADKPVAATAPIHHSGFDPTVTTVIGGSA
jgi:hypothetical protein